MAGGAAPAAAPEVASKDALEVVTQAAQSFFIANERAPKSLEELVSSGFLRQLPAPPEGKKYVYDPTVASLTLADK
jgi:competence protein ComGC